MAMNSPLTSRVVSVPSTVSTQAEAGDQFVAVDVVRPLVQEEFDLRVGAGAVLHGLGCPQLVAAVDQVDLVGEPGEEGGLLHGGVAAADDGDDLLPEEESVTGRAPGDAVPGQPLLVVEAELAVGRAGRVDDG